MGNFKEQAELAENAEFIKRVRTAVGKVCTFIIGEAWDNNKNIYHEKRHKLATDAINSLDLYARKFSDAITSANTDISLASTDSDIEFMCASVFNDLAGIKQTES